MVILFLYAIATYAMATDPSRHPPPRSQVTNALSLLLLLLAATMLALTGTIMVSALVERPRSTDARGMVLLYMPALMAVASALAIGAVLPKANLYGRRMVRIVLGIGTITACLVLYSIYLHFVMKR